MINVNSKKAAVFGIESRIAIVILAIASMAIAMNKLSVSESDKLKSATFEILQVGDLVKEYYEQENTNLSELETIYAQNTVVQNKLWKGQDYLKTDPWGSEWVIKAYNGDITLLGQTVNVKCVIVFSAGFDEYHYLETQVAGNTFTNCLDNVGLPSGTNDSKISDDFFYKFTTAEIELNRLEKTTNQLEAVRNALVSYEQAKYNIELKYCDNLSTSAANSNSRCDIDSSGVYEASELAGVNYYPKSAIDLVPTVVYFNNTIYAEDDLPSMETLMTELGLPTTYAQDPFKRLLKYNSNKESSLIMPFVAEVFYE